MSNLLGEQHAMILQSLYDALPLRDGRKIRLLQVLPQLDIDDETIRCLLHVSIIDSTKAYQALSYTWGPPVFGQDEVYPKREWQIRCNDVPLLVTENLYMFLTRFRQTSALEDIW